MKLYHGSTLAVTMPLTKLGRPDLDFGPGFYLTELREQAEKWAKVKSGRKKDAAAILNIYNLDEELFTNAYYRSVSFKGYNIDWLNFVAFSRKGQQLWKDYDFVQGGIANDSVITTVDLYVDGLITAQQALDQLAFETPNHQLCILNQEIIDQYLQFVDSVKL